jgi:peptidoglycan hydrolase-like protein with peptidoglycan-binding domain
MNRLLAAAAIVALTGAPVALAQTQTTAPSSGASSGNLSPGGMSMQHPGTVHATSDQMKQAQTELKSQGLYNGQVDGKGGPHTKAALTAYQKEKGLQQTGTLDQQTMNSLMGSSGASGQQQQ